MNCASCSDATAASRYSMRAFSTGERSTALAIGVSARSATATRRDISGAGGLLEVCGSSATAPDPPSFAPVARLLPLAEELRVAHHRLSGMAHPPVCNVGVVVGNADHEAGGLHRPPPHMCESIHVPPRPRRSRSPCFAA